jgi:hypothetical protein
MKTRTFLCGAAALAVAGVALAKDFPLETKILKPQEAMGFPGGSGTFGPIQLKADKVDKEPKPVSKHPLYGRLFGQDLLEKVSMDQAGATNLPGGMKLKLGWLFRLDESKGDGKGFDQLILDLNQNGDLTDDPVIKAVALPKGERLSAGRDEVFFGPIEMARQGQWRPVYYAESMIFNREMLTNRSEDGVLGGMIGMLRLIPGSYLETTINLDGVKRKVGIIDGNANLKLGDIPKPEYAGDESTNKTEATEWDFQPGDSFLVDRDGSGKFEGNQFGTESTWFGPVLYLGATPYKVGITADYATLQVEPWPGPLAELSIRPRGEFVRSVVLAWESASNQWQLIEPQVVDGKCKVPPGRLRLCQCLLEGKSGKKVVLMANGQNNSTTNTLTASAGQTTALVCGAPLQLEISANPMQAGLELMLPDEGPAAQPPAAGARKNSDVVRINVRIVGAGGEAYSTFGKGKNFADDPSPPAVTILKDGKKIGSGNLEFG